LLPEADTTALMESAVISAPESLRMIAAKLVTSWSLSAPETWKERDIFVQEKNFAKQSSKGREFIQLQD
jgi:hypothetical protein